jgi:hypothetical protein
MKAIVLVALILAVGNSVGRANEIEISSRVHGAYFAAMSLTGDQGMRATVSNVVQPSSDPRLAVCSVQVRFFGADGSLIGDATTVQLKPGESTSVPASNPPKLVRATVTTDELINGSKPCLLKTSIEIFDVQTGMTFVSMTGETLDGNSDRGQSTPSALRFERKNLTNRKNSTPVASSSFRSRGASPKNAAALVAATPPIMPR